MRVGLVTALLCGAVLTIAAPVLADPDAAHHGDYIDVTGTDQLATDGSLSFAWARGTATLHVDGEERTIAITEDGVADKVIKLQPG